jgi:hypothetical protein
MPYENEIRHVSIRLCGRVAEIFSSTPTEQLPRKLSGLKTALLDNLERDARCFVHPPKGKVGKFPD